MEIMKQENKRKEPTIGMLIQLTLGLEKLRKMLFMAK